MRAARLVLLLLLVVVIRRICCDELTTEEIEDAIDNMEFEEQMEDMFTHMLRHCNFALCKPLREYNDYICEHFWLYLGTRLFLYVGPGNILMAYTLKWVLMAICFCVGWWDGPVVKGAGYKVCKDPFKTKVREKSFANRISNVLYDVLRKGKIPTKYSEFMSVMSKEYAPDSDEEEAETELQARIRAPRASRDSRSFSCSQQQQPGAAAAAASTTDEVETVEAAAEEGTVGNIRHLRRQSTSIGETLGLMGYSGSDSDNE
ncbi:hypothetical protein PRIPAC_73103 [Pristionchus pacificus]|uniref:Uncharacterized protein n=1 Tax=Pristionchus pacificus TaxID=54126 RepID=A0A2A6C0A5_PRIPA|nr:hypothetical protein PRIPAC_73103 [Pristionchus pacificus]|eukprot:PDM71517.1 hypothetical protein PRIPAC_37924 [Pristionchus pacificus]